MFCIRICIRGILNACLSLAFLYPLLDRVHVPLDGKKRNPLFPVPRPPVSLVFPLPFVSHTSVRLASSPRRGARVSSPFSHSLPVPAALTPPSPLWAPTTRLASPHLASVLTPIIWDPRFSRSTRLAFPQPSSPTRHAAHAYLLSNPLILPIPQSKSPNSTSAQRGHAKWPAWIPTSPSHPHCPPRRHWSSAFVLSSLSRPRLPGHHHRLAPAIPTPNASTYEGPSLSQVNLTKAHAKPYRVPTQEPRFWAGARLLELRDDAPLF
ncbi:hypothetical protein BOTBODRAFT_181953 [Botryobasidium botryosum FD-172 SS1]|uniref:Uncharacterized protein n=1 Tax=Botryobasidium botryosum (strain FD-172 SS1) TaxID=930990 RepID=A0A067LUW8_BOTB1|nr:hypothetical protein BOTBODRAFT_181953 [Botryobasidium botryosum FD-172 SS1]